MYNDINSFIEDIKKQNIIIPKKSCGFESTVTGEVEMVFKCAKLVVHLNVEELHKSEDFLDTQYNATLYNNFIYPPYYLFMSSNQLDNFKRFIHCAVQTSIGVYGICDEELLNFVSDSFIEYCKKCSMPEFFIYLNRLYSMEKVYLEELIKYYEVDKDYIKLIFLFNKKNTHVQRLYIKNYSLGFFTVDFIKNNKIGLQKYLLLRLLYVNIKNKIGQDKLLDYYNNIFKGVGDFDELYFFRYYLYSHDFRNLYFFDKFGLPIELLKDYNIFFTHDKNYIIKEAELNIRMYGKIPYSVYISYSSHQAFTPNVKSSKSIDEILECKYPHQNRVYAVLDYLISSNIEIKILEKCSYFNYLKLEVISKYNIKIKFKYDIFSDSNQSRVSENYYSGIELFYGFTPLLKTHIIKYYNDLYPLYRIYADYNDLNKHTTYFYHVMRDLFKNPKLSVVVNYLGLCEISNRRDPLSSISFDTTSNTPHEFLKCSKLALKTIRDRNDYNSINVFALFDSLIDIGLSKEFLIQNIKEFRTLCDYYIRLREIRIDIQNNKILSWIKYYVTTYINNPGHKYLIDLYVDYIRMCNLLEIKYLYIRPGETINRLNNDTGELEKICKIKAYHDDLSILYSQKSKIENRVEINRIYNLYENKLNNVSNGDYVLILPKTSKEIINEGHVLGHCVASYIPKIVKGQCIITFLRNKNNINKPLYTVELVYTVFNTYVNYQFRGQGNSIPPREAVKALDNILLKINK